MLNWFVAGFFLEGLQFYFRVVKTKKLYVIFFFGGPSKIFEPTGPPGLSGTRLS